MSTSASDQQEEVARWLVQLEAAVGEKGWEQDHLLWLCSTRPIGTGLFGEPLTQVIFSPLPLPEVGRNETHVFLNWMADELRAMPDLRKDILHMTVNGTLFAVALSAEGWEIPPADVPAWRGRSWGLHPQREDKRMILCVDVNAKVYDVSRNRSSDQVNIAHDAIEDVLRIEGAVPKALTNVLLALLER